MFLRGDCNPRMDLYAVLQDKLRKGQIDEKEVKMYPKGERYHPKVSVKLPRHSED